jgi:hypothetical protein
VIVAPHFGQGALTPAKWDGTRNFASQWGQVNLIFFTSFRLYVSVQLSDGDSMAHMPRVQTTEQGVRLDKTEESRLLPRQRALKRLILIRRNATKPSVSFKIKRSLLSNLQFIVKFNRFCRVLMMKTQSEAPEKMS